MEWFPLRFGHNSESYVDKIDFLSRSGDFIPKHQFCAVIWLKRPRFVQENIYDRISVSTLDKSYQLCYNLNILEIYWKYIGNILEMTPLKKL